MDDSFYAAYFHRRRSLFRRQLRHYCAAHALTLSALESPLLQSGAPVTARDLIIAVRVVSSPDPFAPDLRFSLRDWLYRHLLERQRSLLLSALAVWEAYILDHTSGPQFWESEIGGGGRALTAPHILSLVAKYRRHYSATRVEAWTLPLSELQWEIAAADEIDGNDTRFFYPSDLPDEQDEIDMRELTEEELRAQAIEHLGPDRAAAWWEARQQHSKESAVAS